MTRGDALMLGQWLPHHRGRQNQQMMIAEGGGGGRPAAASEAMAAPIFHGHPRPNHLQEPLRICSRLSAFARCLSTQRLMSQSTMSGLWLFPPTHEDTLLHSHQKGGRDEWRNWNQLPDLLLPLTGWVLDVLLLKICSL